MYQFLHLQVEDNHSHSQLDAEGVVSKVLLVKGPASSKASKALIVQRGLSLIAPLHLSLHGVSKAQHPDASTCVSPSSAPAFAPGSKVREHEGAGRRCRACVLGQRSSGHAESRQGVLSRQGQRGAALPGDRCTWGWRQ